MYRDNHTSPVRVRDVREFGLSLTLTFISFNKKLERVKPTKLYVQKSLLSKISLPWSRWVSFNRYIWILEKLPTAHKKNISVGQLHISRYACRTEVTRHNYLQYCKIGLTRINNTITFYWMNIFKFFLPC